MAAEAKNEAHASGAPADNRQAINPLCFTACPQILIGDAMSSANPHGCGA